MSNSIGGEKSKIQGISRFFLSLIVYVFIIFFLGCTQENQEYKETNKINFEGKFIREIDQTLVKKEFFANYTLITEYYDSNSIRLIYKVKKCHLKKLIIAPDVDDESRKEALENNKVGRDSSLITVGSYIEFWRNGVVKSIKTFDCYYNIEIFKGKTDNSTVEFTEFPLIGDSFKFDSTGKIIN